PVLTFNPDAGVIVQSGDFRIAAWGFAERLINPDGKDSWRRVRQGAEFDLTRITPHLRPAVVYEVDLTNSNFLRNGPFRRNLENLFVTLQDADDPGKFRLLFGHNTHILSRDDNLSSGNLPTINRSLILEEHGSVNAFGAQMGFQLQKALSPKATIQLSVGDNRGSLNAGDVRSSIGRSVAGKALLTPINDSEHGRKLTYGFCQRLHKQHYQPRFHAGDRNRPSAAGRHWCDGQQNDVRRRCSLHLHGSRTPCDH
ncbi:hypothetical protein, partial [Sphingorhabdus sp.]|uniref:hypothetical protein n=1 Tax=Sphingorhabdus sp. TaxID=1902408 RepID=UPI00333F10D4